MDKFVRSLEKKYLEEKYEQDLRLIEKEDICSIIRNKEMKHLIIVKQYPESVMNSILLKKIL